MMNPVDHSVNRAWDRIDVWLAEHAAGSFAALNPPATPQRLEVLQETLGLTLPTDLVESLLRHDGVPNARPQFTLFGDDRPLPIAEIVDNWQGLNRVFYEDSDYEEFEGDEFRGWHRQWLPVTRDCAGCLWVYDLRPGPRHGTFVRVDHDTGIDFDATWPSLAALLDQVATTLETGAAADGARPEVDEETCELFW